MQVWKYGHLNILLCFDYIFSWQDFFLLYVRSLQTRISLLSVSLNVVNASVLALLLLFCKRNFKVCTFFPFIVSQIFHILINSSFVICGCGIVLSMFGHYIISNSDIFWVFIRISILFLTNYGYIFQHTQENEKHV